MRIYNGKKSQLQIPLGNGENICVGPQSISRDFLPSTNFLNLLVGTFHYDEIALIVNGITETNLCSSIPACNGFVCYTVSEAVEKFMKPDPSKETKNPGVLEPEKKEKKERKKKEEESENPSNS